MEKTKEITGGIDWFKEKEIVDEIKILTQRELGLKSQLDLIKKELSGVKARLSSLILTKIQTQ